MECSEYRILEKRIKSNEIKCIKDEKYKKIIIFLNGNIKVRIKDEIKNTKMNNFIILDEKSEVELLGAGIEKSEYYYIIYIEDRYLDILGASGLDLKFCFRESLRTKRYLVEAKEVIGITLNLLMKRILNEDITNGFGKKEYIRSLLTIIFIIINRGYILETDKERKLENIDIVDSIMIYIEEHLAEKIKLEDIEKEFYLNKFYICKKFKKRTGETIYRYIIKKKLLLAKELIEKNMPIKEIYQLCGFENYSNFFRSFKNEFNMTPRQYYRMASDSEKIIQEYLKSKKN